MNKIVVVHQPDFLPYLGFFHRLLYANVYVILDNVQFLRGSRTWHKRDKIKTQHGIKWLTVGVKYAPRETNINETLLADNDWREKNLNLIREGYRNALFFDEIFPHIEKLYAFKCKMLVDFNLQSLNMLMGLFDIKVETVLASNLSVAGKSNKLLVNILKKIGGTTYLSGIGAKDYFDPLPFEDDGIKVIWQNFKHPVYPQLYGNFVSYLSSIDLLFNCGIEKSSKILRSC